MVLRQYAPRTARQANMHTGQSSCAGMLRVIRFNWPMYLLAVVLTFVLLYLSLQPALVSVSALFWLAAGYSAYQTAASLLASWWVYDLSALKSWQWVSELVPLESEKIVQVYAGYDESGGRLRSLFSSSDYSVIDFYDALPRREPSIVRARKLYPSSVAPLCSTLTNWPMAPASVDVVVIAFAAHEIRDASQREALFNQVSVVLKENGRLILVEHLRDLANLVAFGPGFVHFLPESEWKRCAASANLRLLKRQNITPLVGVFVLCR